MQLRDFVAELQKEKDELQKEKDRKTPFREGWIFGVSSEPSRHCR